MSHRLTWPQKRALLVVRDAQGRVPLLGWGSGRHPYDIDPRTVEVLCREGYLDTYADEEELRIEGVELTPRGWEACRDLMENP